MAEPGSVYDSEKCYIYVDIRTEELQNLDGVNLIKSRIKGIAFAMSG